MTEAAATLPAQPTSLNGYPVIRLAAHENGYSTVMCELPRGAASRFVVATWWPDLKNSWSWGNYCDSKAAATRAWAEVDARNQRRG